MNNDNVNWYIFFGIMLVICIIVGCIRYKILTSNREYTKTWWRNIRLGICPECGGYGRQRSNILNCNHCGGCGLAKKSLMIAEGVWKDYAKGKSKAELEEHEYTLTVEKFRIR